MTSTDELAVKVDRARKLLHDRSLPAVLLRKRANFAWITCGGSSHVNTSSEMGVASVLITPDRLVLVTNNIEADRLLEEEISHDLHDAFELAVHDWFDPEGETRNIDKLLSGGCFASDAGAADSLIPDAIAALRTPLTSPEIARYKSLGHLTSQTTEAVCRAISPGMTENHVAAMIQGAFTNHDVRVPVCLIAADHRIEDYRHPVHTHLPMINRVLVVVCAESQGLICSMTRLVSLKPMDAVLRRKHDAVVRIEAEAMHATRPGRTLDQVFHDIVLAYHEAGFPDEYRLHHQGGSTGYEGRDVFATPHTHNTVYADQAFAWNPSITGTKSEDTILATAEGHTPITQPGPDWPTIEVEIQSSIFRRPDILLAHS